jgi:hypothetical protein
LRSRLLLATLATACAATGLLGTATAAQANPPVRSTEPTGDLIPSGSAPDRTEERGCLRVTSTLSAAPAVGRSATLDVTVQAAIDLSAVDVTTELPPNLRWVTAPTGLTQGTRVSKAPHNRGTLQTAHTRRAFAAGQTLHYRGVVEAVAAGPAEIAVRASSTAGGTISTADDPVHLTIGTTSSKLGIAVDRTVAAVPSGVAAPAAASAAPGDTCINGSWLWTDHNGGIQPGVAWKAEAYDADASGGDDLLATGSVGPTGVYVLCFDNSTDEDGTGQDVYVKFTADAGNWRVQTFDGYVYTYSSTPVSNVATGSNTNLSLTPGDASQMRAAEAFDAVRRGWDFKPGSCWDLSGSCRPVVVLWTPDSTDGTYYAPWSDDVHLAASDPDAPTTVLHEAGHSIMDDIYEDNYPPFPNCNPHGIPATSSTGCAWTEGFAEWWPASVLNDPFYRWPGGGYMDLENVGPYESNWDRGDAVEGRVAGALIDLTDSNNEGDDTITEEFATNWSVIQNSLPNTFAEYWTARGAAGLPVDTAALALLAQNSIEYGTQSAACEATWNQVNAYSGGYTAEVKVTAGPGAISGWKVSFTLPSGTTITNIWNGVNSGTSGAVSVTNMSYNGGLAAGQSTTFGFQGAGNPAGVTLSCAKV